MWGVLNDWNPQGIMIAEVSQLLISLAKALDLLDIVYLEQIGVRRGRLQEEGYQDGPLRVCVDAASGIALGERSNE